MHVFEFYEETFPDHSIRNQINKSQRSSEGATTVQKVKNQNKQGRGSLESEMTTPTDVETPDKDIFGNNLKQKVEQKLSRNITIAENKKDISSKTLSEAAGSLLSGLYLNQVK